MIDVGQTHDVAPGIQRHAAGSGSRQAKQLNEFVLVYVEGSLAADDAAQRERQPKK
ncbi:MAG: hypothetical protein ACLFS4_03680 [Opitutales bacterium]